MANSEAERRGFDNMIVNGYAKKYLMTTHEFAVEAQKLLA